MLSAFITLLILFCALEINLTKKMVKSELNAVMNMLSKQGFEVAYDELSIGKSLIANKIKLQNFMIYTASNKLIAKEAVLEIKMQGKKIQNFVISAQDLTFDDEIKIKTMQIAAQRRVVIAEDIGFEAYINIDNIIIDNVIQIDELAIRANNIGKNFEISKLTLNNQSLAMIAVGEAFVNNAQDFSFKLKTSSNGLVETMDKLVVAQFFEGKGVYIVKLILGTTNQMSNIPIELVDGKLLIKGIVVK